MSPGIPAFTAFDQPFVKIPFRGARRPRTSCRHSLRLDLLIFLYHGPGNRTRFADALCPQEDLCRALKMDRIQARFLHRIPYDVGPVSFHHQRETLSHGLGRSLAVFMIGAVEPWAHRHSFAELDRML